MESLAARHSLEIRRPFYTKEFVEFAFVTPDRLRSIGSRIKVIHTESLKGILPESVRERRTKAEFSCVFHAQLQSLGEYLTVNLPGARPEWFDRRGMEKLWQGYLEQPNAGWHGWCLWGSASIGLSLGA
jgi:asparagine synthase (glutamine-hydrolysing)